MSALLANRNLAPESIEVVAAGIRDVLVRLGQPLVGVSCRARGADQVFARTVLELGGRLEVVLPAGDYRERKVKPDNRAQFEELITRADRVTVCPFEVSGREAYEAASDRVLALERLVAVWDGSPADGRGSTGDVVAAARERGLPIDIVWPVGSKRT